MSNKLITFSVFALLGMSTVALSQSAQWIFYKAGDGQVPKGDCLEMVCPHGCVEKADGTFAGHCCPAGPVAGTNCKTDAEDVYDRGCLIKTKKVCPSTHFCAADGTCQPLCEHLFKYRASRNGGQGDDLGCCGSDKSLVKDPAGGTSGWAFRGYKQDGNDFYGCCLSVRIAGKNCCTKNETACTNRCCSSSQNCCSGRCCNKACNKNGTACCSDRAFGNKSEFLNYECDNKGKCGYYTRYRWKESGTLYEVDSQKNMNLSIDIIGISDFSHLKIRDVTGNKNVLNMNSLSGNSLNKSITLLKGHTYRIDLELTNSCGGSCNITAKCL